MTATDWVVFAGVVLTLAFVAVAPKKCFGVRHLRWLYHFCRITPCKGHGGHAGWRRCNYCLYVRQYLDGVWSGRY